MNTQHANHCNVPRGHSSAVRGGNTSSTMAVPPRPMPAPVNITMTSVRYRSVQREECAAGDEENQQRGLARVARANTIMIASRNAPECPRLTVKVQLGTDQHSVGRHGVARGSTRWHVSSQSQFLVIFGIFCTLRAAARPRRVGSLFQ